MIIPRMKEKNTVRGMRFVEENAMFITRHKGCILRKKTTSRFQANIP